MEKAIVNKIIPFSNVDGPGNRMAIFFQGCPFHCLYCHNPETINKCNNCLLCVSACKSNALSIKDGHVVWNEEKCIGCDACIHTCKRMSSPKTKEYSVDMLLDKIKEARPFIRGISVSGGECMLNAAFLEELFKRVKPLGLTCLIDSNGALDFRKYESLIKLSDGVMLDVKAYDDDFHKRLTDVSNEMVLKNLDYLLKIDKLFEVRTVILPNEDSANSYTVKMVSQIIKSRVKYKLLKYRYFGVREEGVNQFGKVIVEEAYLKEMQKIAVENGCNSSVII